MWVQWRQRVVEVLRKNSSSVLAFSSSDSDLRLLESRFRIVLSSPFLARFSIQITEVLCLVDYQSVNNFISEALV